MNKEVKLYKVEFNSYASFNSVYYFNDNGHEIYLEIPFGGLIIREDEFDKYRVFGEGFKKLEFLGCMYE